MIGHFLLTLTPEQETRLLTTRLVPQRLLHDDGSRCLLGVVQDAYGRDERTNETLCREAVERFIQWKGMITPDHYSIPVKRHRSANWSIAHRFDALCARFGVARVNEAIRNRVLANQARRTLAQPVEVA